TMRAVDETGFGPKVRAWNRTEMVGRWRERWAEIANKRLAELDIDARIDHRSLEAQGIALEPQSQVGAPAKRIEERGIEGQGIEAGSAQSGRTRQGRSRRGSLHHPRDDRGGTAPAPRRRTDGRA